MFDFIKSKQDLWLYLSETQSYDGIDNDGIPFYGSPHTYNIFIWEKLQDQNYPKKSTLNCPMDKHHIIPIHKSKRLKNQPWNLICLKELDHKEAHVRRLEVFGEQGDLLGLRFFSGTMTSRERAVASRASQRLKGTGVYDSKLQRKKGQVGGKVKSVAKDLTYQARQSEPVRDLISIPSYYITPYSKAKLYVPAQLVVTHLKPYFIQFYQSMLTGVILVNQSDLVKIQTNLESIDRTNSPDFSSAFRKLAIGDRKSIWGFSISNK
jgi:hypothetical protein